MDFFKPCGNICGIHIAGLGHGLICWQAAPSLRPQVVPTQNDLSGVHARFARKIVDVCHELSGRFTGVAAILIDLV